MLHLNRKGPVSNRECRSHDDERTLMARSRDRRRKIVVGRQPVYATGLSNNWWADLYHNAMMVSWLGFLGATALAFVGINALFASIYLLGRAPISYVGPGDFLHLFYFSVETLATVGYGDMHPQTDFGHVVASVETFLGLFLTAMLTGLIFARISRPRARLLFSNLLTVGQHDGEWTLSCRIANARLNMISGATAKLWVLRTRFNTEGVRFRGFEELKLERAENPVFSLSWTLFHVIDESSPLAGLDRTQLSESDANFLLTVTGHDESAAQTIFARETYKLEDVRWNARFADIIATDPQNLILIDYKRFDEIVQIKNQPASASSPS